MSVAFAVAAFICSAPLAVDGDTLRCIGMGRVRLANIDAPELAGHCAQGRTCTPGDGNAATEALRSLLRGRSVSCQPVNRDRYGRIVANCQAGGTDLSCAMVDSGHAVERYGRLNC